MRTLLTLTLAAIVTVTVPLEAQWWRWFRPSGVARPVTAQSHRHVVDGVTFIWSYTCDGGDCQHGQFLDGTWWVYNPSGGNVVLTSVTPDDAASGLEKNPATGTEATTFTQGLYANSGADSTYSSGLDLSTQLPYTAAPDDGVYVKAKAYTGGDCGYTGAVGANCLDTFDALTVVADVPADFGANTFRPGMSGTAKTWLTTSDLDLTRLPSLAAVTPGNYSGIVSRWGSPFPSYYTGGNPDHARRWAPKARGTSDYAADRAEVSLADLFGVFGSDSLTDAKKRAVYAMVQYGLDIYAGYTEGVRFHAGAGQGQGFWHPMVLLGALTTNATVLANIQAAPTSGGLFTEFFQLRRTDAGVPIWGDECPSSGLPSGNGFYWSTYASGMRGYTGSSARTCKDPYDYIDGPGEGPGRYYASCCSTGVYVSIALVMRIWPEFDDAANYSVVREYAERVMDGAGWWVADDALAAYDPREPDDCSPYTTATAASTCDYWGVTWGERPDGTPITIADATTAGHPSPGPRWDESTYHLKGRPTLDRQVPGDTYWDVLDVE